MMPTLLRKLLSKRDDDGAAARPRESPRPWASSEFDLAQIRLLVYQDCERRGRQVLFDSKAVCRPDGPELASEEKKTLRGRASEREKPPAYQYTRAASDVNMLAEMMFGAVSMSYRGSTLKVHHIRSPPQLMVSKVFSTGSRGSTTLQESLESVSQTFSSSIIHSDPVEMPRRGGSEDGDSGFTRSASLSSLLTTPLATPLSSPSSSLSSSYHRRLMRSQTTSLQHGPLHRWSAEEMFSVSEESCSSAPAPVHRRKIAISIIITLPEKSHEQQAFQEFFFSHFPLIESHMNRLKTAIEQAMAGCRRVVEHDQRVQQYLCAVMEALSEFRMTVWNMYMAPRISEPVWLTMISQNAERSRLCQRFLQELRLLMEHGAKSRFLSTLLTAVLTHHLAWVSTVTPCSHPPITELPTKPASFSVGRLSKSHPYNPLWAQLVDLYGALGSPLRMCRTVVVGRQRELVQRVLYVLSYFIRCSELLERQHSPTDGPTHPCSAPLTDQSAPGLDHLTAAERSSEQLSANQSTGPSRVLFHIGSPGEAERGRRAGGPEGPDCGRKGPLVDIRRAESSDSALGVGDEEEPCRSEMELPLPSCAEESRTGVHHFGRSLLAGFCPQYLPDFVLHGAASDERLERCLRGDLEHAVLHPALDERVCDALCIVADVERVCVRVVSSQKGGTEGGASGQDVLTSNLVHSLLTSILQLHALNVTAEFCVMHLEDRLQEVYLKSGSLAEYLRGRTRVCVQDLALALGVESSDVPLLAAVAGTHSPHVTRVLL